MTSGQLDINGWPIWYEKFGTGSEIMLFLPGAIGTGRSDFLPQLEGAHSFDHRQYTIIAMELPGWGRSRPPERPYGQNVYINDADVAAKLMETLGYKNYIVFCFSDGGKVGLTMSIRYPSRIKGLVLISIFTIISPKTVAPTLATANTSKWPQEILDNYLPVYGNEDNIQKMWDGYINFCKFMFKSFPNGYVNSKLETIRCPVFVFHGDLDPLVCVDHPILVEKLVPYCQLHRFPKGGHNCHHRYPADVKRLTEQFIRECNDFR